MVIVAGIAFLIAAVLTPVSARLAVVWGWIDEPDGRRKVHRSGVPAIGGIAVFAGFTAAMLYVQWAGHAIVAEAGPFLEFWAPLVFAGWCVSAIGFLDDLRGAGPVAKLAVQVAAALYLYFNGFQIHGISNPFDGPLELGALALPLTVLWLVGMSNAFNLIDGLDGLAAGLALVSTLGLLVAAAVSGRWETVLVSAALAGALVGFLPYNISPARVFLGDCGALPVGFVLAAIAVKSSMKASAAVAVAVPLLALALPILDVGLAVVRRIVRRRPLFTGDRDHIHHRLVDLGLTPRRAVVTLYAVAVLFAALAMAVAMGPEQVAWAAGAVVLLVAWAGVRALGYWEVTEFQRSMLSRIMSGLRPSDDAALRGLEADIERARSFEEGWWQVCATAWSLGFVELKLDEAPGTLGPRAERHDQAPRPWPLLGSRSVRAEATWTVELMRAGRGVGTLTARRRLNRVDFEPMRFVAAVEQLVERFGPPAATSEAHAAADATLTVAPERPAGATAR